MPREPRSAEAEAALRLVHTSDLHLFAARPAEEERAMVSSLAATVLVLNADALAVAGDGHSPLVAHDDDGGGADPHRSRPSERGDAPRRRRA